MSLRYVYFEHQKARGPRWALETIYFTCACGNERVSVKTNMRNGDQLMTQHLTPSGTPCPEYSWQEGRERTRAICIKAGVAP